MGLFDNMDGRPIQSSEWAPYDIIGTVDADAEYLNIGLMSIGRGRAWIDGVSFEIAPVSSPAETAAAGAALAKLYAAIDAAYEKGDLNAMAGVALPRATVGMNQAKIPLRVALDQIKAEMQKGVKFGSRTRVESVHEPRHRPSHRSGHCREGGRAVETPCRPARVCRGRAALR
jgi:hypothetical protein